MSIETRTSRLVKKIGVEKSRWTVPLSNILCWVILHWIHSKMGNSTLSKILGWAILHILAQATFSIFFTFIHSIPGHSAFMMRIDGTVLDNINCPGWKGIQKMRKFSILICCHDDLFCLDM